MAGVGGWHRGGRRVVGSVATGHPQRGRGRGRAATAAAAAATRLGTRPRGDHAAAHGTGRRPPAGGGRRAGGGINAAAQGWGSRCGGATRWWTLPRDGGVARTRRTAVRGDGGTPCGVAAARHARGAVTGSPVGPTVRWTTAAAGAAASAAAAAAAAAAVAVAVRRAAAVARRPMADAAGGGAPRLVSPTRTGAEAWGGNGRDSGASAPELLPLRSHEQKEEKQRM